MMERPTCSRLADGKRLHLCHGPISIVLQALGEPAAVRDAEQAATNRFATILEELCDELFCLRTPMCADSCAPQGATARRMHDAVRPFAARSFITPMAAVAGAVADEILQSMTEAAMLEKAYVNNGGDIAVHLSPACTFTAGIVDRVAAPHIVGTTRITGACPVRGIATSGWGGRSFSRGIADAVTILAASAAAADAAATIVANAVDLPGHPGISRHAAATLQPDSDLGDMMVTTGVGALGKHEIADALANGLRVAQEWVNAGRIAAAALFLQAGHTSTRNFVLAGPPLPQAAVHA